MTVNQIVRIVAGFFIMTSLVLAHFSPDISSAPMVWPRRSAEQVDSAASGGI